MRLDEKADRAAQVLQDPVFRAAFDDIRLDFLAKLELVPQADHAAQHELVLMLQLLRRLRTQLESYGQEKLIDNVNQRRDTFLQRTREALTPLIASARSTRGRI